VDCNPNRTRPVFEFELNRCSLSKVIERTPNFDNGRTDRRTDGRTHARTGVTLNGPPPFFEWRGHKNNLKSPPKLYDCSVFKVGSGYLKHLHYYVWPNLCSLWTHLLLADVYLPLVEVLGFLQRPHVRPDLLLTQLQGRLHLLELKCYSSGGSVVRAFAPWAGGRWFDPRPRHTKDVIKMVPDACLLSAQHIRTGLASLSSQTSLKKKRRWIPSGKSGREWLI